MGQPYKKEGMVTFVEGFKYQNGNIESDTPLSKEVLTSPVIIFKKIFSENFLNQLRETVVKFNFKYNDYTRGEGGLTFNYTRVDNLHDRKRRARYNVSYSFYFWDKETPKIALDVYYAMVKFGNRLSGRKLEDRLKLQNEKIGTMSYFYYPSGGFLGNHHFDDDIGGYDEIYDEIIIQFSKYGRDYQQGGVYLAPRYRLSEDYSSNNHGELQFIEPHIAPGDVMAISIKDVYHKVTPVDPDLNYFDPMKGRFIASMYYVPTEDLKKLSKTVKN